MNDIYGTDIDQSALGFSNPMNSANMNPGFGINPSLLTPAFQAPYRPPYAQTQGYTPYGNPGFFKGAYNVFGPTRDPVYGNPTDSMHNSVHSMASRPFDATMWGIQNLALPYAGYTGMAHVLGPASSGLWGMTKGLWKGEGIAAGFGRGVGSGLADGVGLSGGVGKGVGWAAKRIGMSSAGSASMAASAASGVSGFAGGIGGLAAGLSLPFIAGEMATRAADQGIIQPYLQSRKASDEFQRNFQGIYLGNGMGNAVTGKGIGGLAGAQMGNMISQYGLNDNMFSRESFTAISDYSARSGLLDNVNGKQITNRVKDISEQIKLIISISKDPDIKSAIEQLSKLNMAGASTFGGARSSAASTLRLLGGYAAQSGTTVQKLMNTVGAQGQYMYQANGMTPYMGQLEAANLHAGFVSANRSGIISPAAMARLGGPEGATQSALSAQMSAVQTPYAVMGMFNKMFAGAGGSSVPGFNQNPFTTSATFANAFGKDPVGTLGAMSLHGPGIASQMLAEGGGATAEAQATSILRAANIPPQGKDGKYTAEQLMTGLERMGIDKTSARAYIYKRYADQDPETYQNKMEALRGYGAENARQWINQSGYGGGPFDSGARYIGQGLKSVGSTVSTLAYSAARGVGISEDFLTKAGDWWNVGKSIKDGVRVQNVDDMFSDLDLDATSKRTVTFDIDEAKSQYGGWAGTQYGKDKREANSTDFRRSLRSVYDQRILSAGDSFNLLSNIKKLSLEGNKDAKTYLSEHIDPKGREAALGRMIKNNKDKLGPIADKLDMNSSISGFTMDDFNANLHQLRRITDFSTDDKFKKEEFQRVGSDYATLVEASRVSSGLKSSDRTGFEDLYTVGAANGLMAKLFENKDVTNDNLVEYVRKNKQFANILKLAGGDSATAEDIRTTAMDIQKRSLEQGTVGIGSQLFNSIGARDYESLTDNQRVAELNVAAKKRGGQIIGNRFTHRVVKDADMRELNGYVAKEFDLSQQFAKSYEDFTSGKTDYITFRKITGGMDATTTFAAAVDKFAKSVDKDSKSSIVPVLRDAASTVGKKLNLVGDD